MPRLAELDGMACTGPCREGFAMIEQNHAEIWRKWIALCASKIPALIAGGSP
jgi:hypothetical protein